MNIQSLRCLLCTLLWLCCLNVFAQERIYVQHSTRTGTRFLSQPLKFEENRFLVFLTGQALILADLNGAEATELAYETAGVMKTCGYEYMGDTIVGWMSNFQPAMFRLASDRVVLPTALHPHLVGGSAPLMCENSPILYSDPLATDTCLVSIDNGSTWMAIQNPGMSKINASNSGCLYAASLGQVRMLRTVHGNLRVDTLPITGISVSTIAHTHNDSLYWINDSGKKLLKTGKLNSPTGMVVDSAYVGNKTVRLQPLAVFGLPDSTVLYLDNTGWSANISHGTFTPFSFRFAPGTQEGSGPLVRPRGGWCYFVQRVRPDRVAYRIHLTIPLEIDSMVIPEGMDYGSSEFTRALLFDVGTVITESEPAQYIVSFRDRKVIVTGSLLKNLDYLPPRATVAAWRDNDRRLLVLTDLDQIVSVDSLSRGILRLGKVHEGRYTVYAADEPQTSFPSRCLREWGLSVPASILGGLVFPGPVVRTLSLDGFVLDTLLASRTSFASKLDNESFASGWHNALRIHRASTIDSSIILQPPGEPTDSMGYPSAMVQCTDGSLLASFQGTWRKDSSTEGKRLFRWGGILKSSDDGKTWQPKPLPDPESNYVQHVMRTANGTLLATCMRMVEDSTPTTPSGTDPARESLYSANRITILRSIDCGETWTEVHKPFYNGPWQLNSGNIVQQSDGRLFAALIPGVYTSTDDGRTWQLDERVNALIVPVSLTLNDDESLLLSANDGVYRLDKLTGVEEESGLSERVRMEVLTPSALLQRLSTGKVEHASVVDLQGRETPLVRRGSVITDVILLLLNGVYGLDVNGERSVVCVKTN